MKNFGSKQMNLIQSLLVAIILLFGSTSYAQTTTIAVAANMKDAFTEINNNFKAEGKADNKVVFGSSGNFTAQILNGAPFNLFISADEQFPLELYKQGKTVDEGKVYAIGKLVLITTKAKGIKLSDNKAELAAIIAKANKISIAKPEVAPYGRAAVEYLKAVGLWELAKDKLVYGENIAMATMFVSSNAADIGFTALSIAKSPELSKDTNYLALNDKLYEPIKQRMVLIKNPTPEATELYNYIQMPKSKDVLRKFGYVVP